MPNPAQPSPPPSPEELQDAFFGIDRGVVVNPEPPRWSLDEPLPLDGPTDPADFIRETERVARALGRPAQATYRVTYATPAPRAQGAKSAHACTPPCKRNCKCGRKPAT